MIHLTNTRSSDDAPGPLREVARKKILHYRQLYINRPDPIVFLPVVVDTTGHIYDDFSRLLFLHTNREPSDLDNEITEESDQFRFLRPSYHDNIKGSVGLILVKVSTMRIYIPIDFHLGLLYHYRVSFVRDVLFHFELLPSFLLLGVLPKRLMRVFLSNSLINFSYTPHSF
jgi:hypothetical protein